MPPRSAEEKARRKLLHEQKKEARRLKKQREEEQKQKAEGLLGTNGEGGKDYSNGNDPNNSDLKKGDCFILTLPEDPFHHLLTFLPARDLGAFSMSCRHVNLCMGEARIHHLFSRLSTKYYESDLPGKLYVPIKICENKNEVEELLVQGLDGCGDTGRLVTKKAKKVKHTCADEYIAYARFIEEAILGRSVQVSLTKTAISFNICSFS